MKLGKRVFEEESVKEVVKFHSSAKQNSQHSLIANAGATKRPTCCVLVLAEEEQQKMKGDYDQVAAQVSECGQGLQVCRNSSEGALVKIDRLFSCEICDMIYYFLKHWNMEQNLTGSIVQ
ncbi:hypothetical protein Leryth_007861 [Lithospermum erythrorhizon]|nr:hypothetical protein Leryth_007861 [Lithospermum erythrorhizon]